MPEVPASPERGRVGWAGASATDRASRPPDRQSSIGRASGATARRAGISISAAAFEAVRRCPSRGVRDRHGSLSSRERPVAGSVGGTSRADRAKMPRRAPFESGVSTSDGHSNSRWPFLPLFGHCPSSIRKLVLRGRPSFVVRFRDVSGGVDCLARSSRWCGRDVIAAQRGRAGVILGRHRGFAPLNDVLGPAHGTCRAYAEELAGEPHANSGEAGRLSPLTQANPTGSMQRIGVAGTSRIAAREQSWATGLVEVWWVSRDRNPGSEACVVANLSATSRHRR